MLKITGISDEHIVFIEYYTPTNALIVYHTLV